MALRVGSALDYSVVVSVKLSRLWIQKGWLRGPFIKRMMARLTWGQGLLGSNLCIRTEHLVVRILRGENPLVYRDEGSRSDGPGIFYSAPNIVFENNNIFLNTSRFIHWSNDGIWGNTVARLGVPGIFLAELSWDTTMHDKTSRLLQNSTIYLASLLSR